VETTHLIGFEILRHRDQLRRLLSLESAAAACAGFARGGDNLTRDWGSRASGRHEPGPSTVVSDSGTLSELCEPDP